MASAVIPALVPTAIVPELLTESNYEHWSTCVKSYLKSQDLWEVCARIRAVPHKSEDPVAYSVWKKRNAMALHALQITCSREMLSQIRRMKSAGEAWDHLKRLADPTLDLGQVVSAADRASSELVEYFSRYDDLREALKKGDWYRIQLLREFYPDAMRTEIEIGGRTMLHCAASAGDVWVMQKLVDEIEPMDLETRDWSGFTPLALTAAQGRTAIARVLITKHRDLANISDGKGILPVVLACKRGEGEMTRFLYSQTRQEELDPDTEEGAINGATLLSNCIACKFLDTALDLLRKKPLLAVSLDMDGLTPFYVLGQRPALFEGRCHLRFWQRWIYSCIPVHLYRDQDSNHIQVHIVDVTEQPQSDGNNDITTVFCHLIFRLLSYLLKLPGIKNICDQKLMHSQAINLVPIICAELKKIYQGRDLGHKVVVQALKQGNVDFVIEMMKYISELEEMSDINGRNIFSLAIVYRQEKIFNHLHWLPDKEKLTYGTDDSGNNVLHLAAMLAPRDQLAGISGATLQMQRELQWFKEVESILPPTYKDHLNSDRKIPSDVFSEQHAHLVKEGEKWMKDIATSSSFVAALIVTIMFAAAFTIPGGNNDKGSPIFLDDKLFMVFIISDSISPFSATTSVLMFLGILTSEYAEDKFLTRLPTKLIIGLSTLFISIAAMVIVFCAALAILLKESSTKLVMIPIILFSCVSVISFTLLQFPLFVKICISTYGPSIFHKK